MNKKHLAAPFGVWMLLFTIIPLGMVLWFALTDENGSFTFSNIPEITNYSISFWYSLYVGALSTIICLLLAYPLAFSISRRSEGVQRTLVMLVMLPMWMNSLLRITALKNIISGNGFLNSALNFFGLPKQHLMGTTTAIIIGMVFDFLPFMVLPLYSVMTKIDNRVLEAAQDLGANSFQVFLRVVLPLSVPGITAGITMVFVPSVSTFVVSELLGSAQIPTMIGKWIESLYKGTTPSFNVGAVLSLVLMVLMLLCMAVMNIFDKDDEMEGMMA